MALEYDVVVVIGSGTGGYVAAIRAAQLGLRTAVVERARCSAGPASTGAASRPRRCLEHAHALKVARLEGVGSELGTRGRPSASTWPRSTRARTGSSRASPAASSSCSRRTRSTGSRAAAGWPAAARSRSPTARSRRSTREGDHRRHRIAAAQRPGIEIDRKRIITSDEAIELKESRSRSSSWAAARSASSSRRSSGASAAR